MAVPAPTAARSAAAAVVALFGSSVEASGIDYTDALVVRGQPVRVVTVASGCARAEGALRESIKRQLADLASRDLVTISIGNGPSTGLDIQYVVSSAVANDTAFVAGLELAAQVWEAEISNPIVVRMGVDFTSGQPYLAAASTTLVGSTFEALRGAMVAQASIAERPYLAAIPTTMSARTPSGLITTDRMSFFPPSALRRALYLENWTPALDAQIVFNTDYDFDPDPSDGVSPGQIDLVTVMCHELGHALGFTSSVDGNELLRQPLDILRYGTLSAVNNPSSLSDVQGVAREWRAGREAALDTVGAISGVPIETRFSTGQTNGDGRQSSHWKDDALLGLSQALGVMDPTYSQSQVPPGIITDADRMALSLIGWDIDVGDPGCAGDADFDGDADLNDLQVLLFYFGVDSPDGDLNYDGTVNLDDLQLLLFTFGGC